MMYLIVGLIVSYLLGSIPTGYIIGRAVKNVDIRTCGSGNTGATNVFRTVGKRWGLFVLICDMLKGLFAVVVVARFVDSGFMPFEYLQCICGVAAICGHNWTIFLRFKGGKGVATTCGMVLGVFPLALGCALLVFATIFYATRYVSLGSVTSAAAFPLFLVLFYRHEQGFAVFLPMSLLLMIFIVFRHRANIVRLLNGTENKISFK